MSLYINDIVVHKPKKAWKLVFNLLRVGGKLTTVGGKNRNPTLYIDSTVVHRPRKSTLDDMVKLGLIHHLVTYVGDGTSCDEEWHLGEGGDVFDKLCVKCEFRDCPLCHPCFQEKKQ